MDKIKAYEELLNRTLKSLRLATYYDYVNRREANKLYDDIKKALSEPTAETDDNWISVKELPDPFVHVLCYMKDGCVDGCVVGYHNGFRWILDIECIDVRCITHWQHLPNDRKEDKL